MTRRVFLVAAASAGLNAQVQPARKRREDCYFGLHFDLHPNDTDPALGRDVTEELVETIIARAKPDFIQYDAKGHAGWLGWPSKVGPSAPHIVRDSLEIYRRVTARRGVSLYIHFSGVWDSEAVKAHPEWARVDAQGERDPRNTSTWSGYAAERMIPQLREAAGKYDLDGAWVDGECWSVGVDYGERALAEFGRTPPRAPDEAGWQEFLEMQRASFRRHVKRYVDALHQSHPKFQVASNWLYSTFVPERPDLPVDFISGDYLGNASISTARTEARYMSRVGKPWDLMAWGFQQGGVHKPAVQLMQEASVVLGQGGGFQIYYQPSRAGRFEPSMIETMARVGAFCREREAVSHRTEPVPQIGVVFSGESLYRTANRCFGGWGRALDPVRGMVDALCACGYSVDILPDWRLDELLPQYKFVVLPDWPATGPAAIESLRRFKGRLLVAGAENAGAFGLEGKPRDQAAFCGGSEVLAHLQGRWLDFATEPEGVVEWRYPALDLTRDRLPLAIERDNMLLAPGPLGGIYARSHAPAVRDLVRRLVRPRFHPLVELDAPPEVELALRQKDGRLLVHLLNTTAMQVAGEYAAVDHIPAAGPVTLKFSGPVRDVELIPRGRGLKVRGSTVTVAEVGVHAVVAARTPMI